MQDDAGQNFAFNAPDTDPIAVRKIVRAWTSSVKVPKAVEYHAEQLLQSPPKSVVDAIRWQRIDAIFTKRHASDELAVQWSKRRRTLLVDTLENYNPGYIPGTASFSRAKPFMVMSQALCREWSLTLFESPQFLTDYLTQDALWQDSSGKTKPKGRPPLDALTAIRTWWTYEAAKAIRSECSFTLGEEHTSKSIAAAVLQIGERTMGDTNRGHLADAKDYFQCIPYYSQGGVYNELSKHDPIGNMITFRVDLRSILRRMQDLAK